jgi:hypothetical protein
MAFELNDRYKILLEALAIIIVALGIGYWLKRKFQRRG